MAGMSVEAYARQLRALLPTGDALSRDEGSGVSKLLLSAAEELARLDGRAVDLFKELDPPTTDELLEDWERILGLPDPCILTEQTIDERRGAIAAKLRSVGGQSKAYILGVLAAFGIEAEIDEQRAFEVGRSGAGEGVGGEVWRFAFIVRTRDISVFPGDEPTLFEVGASGCTDPIDGFEWLQDWLSKSEAFYFNVGTSVVGDPLVDYSYLPLECLVERIKPAHTIALYSYED